MASEYNDVGWRLAMCLIESQNNPDLCYGEEMVEIAMSRTGTT